MSASFSTTGVRKTLARGPLAMMLVALLQTTPGFACTLSYDSILTQIRRVDLVAVVRITARTHTVMDEGGRPLPVASTAQAEVLQLLKGSEPSGDLQLTFPREQDMGNCNFLLKGTAEEYALDTTLLLMLRLEPPYKAPLRPPWLLNLQTGWHDGFLLDYAVFAADHDEPPVDLVFDGPGAYALEDSATVDVSVINRLMPPANLISIRSDASIRWFGST